VNSLNLVMVVMVVIDGVGGELPSDSAQNVELISTTACLLHPPARPSLPAGKGLRSKAPRDKPPPLIFASLTRRPLFVALCAS
jgi:hypothetical protein